MRKDIQSVSVHKYKHTVSFVIRRTKKELTKGNNSIKSGVFLICLQIIKYTQKTYRIHFIMLIDGNVSPRICVCVCCVYTGIRKKKIFQLFDFLLVLELNGMAHKLFSIFNPSLCFVLPLLFFFSECHASTTTHTDIVTMTS